MSIPLVNAVFNQTPMLRKLGLSASDIQVLTRLASRANHKSGRCDPGYGTLADDTGLSKNQVYKSLKALWQAGVIDWTQRWKSDSKQRATNSYQIKNVPDPKDKKKAILQPGIPPSTKEKLSAPEQTKKEARKWEKHGQGPVGVPHTVSEGTTYSKVGYLTQEGTLPHQVSQGTTPGKRETVFKQEEVSGRQPGLESEDGKDNPVQTISRNNEEGAVTTLTAYTPVVIPADAGKQVLATTAVNVPVREFLDQRKHQRKLPSTADVTPVIILADAREQSPHTTAVTVPVREFLDQRKLEETKMAATKSAEQYEKLSPAGKLAWDYFVIMKEPGRFNNPATRQQWAAKFQTLLARHSFTKLKEAIRFAWTEPNFWRDKLYRRNGDPVDYFVDKFEQKNGIEAEYLSWLHAQSLTHPQPEADPLAGTGLTSTPMSVFKQEREAGREQREREEKARRQAAEARRAREAEVAKRVAAYIAEAEKQQLSNQEDVPHER